MHGETQRLTPPRGSRVNLEATRQAALELFVHNGFDRTSMREIARRVGVSAATVYNYTDSKESLLWDLIQQARAGLDSSREGARLTSPCPAEVVRAAMMAMTRYHLDHPQQCQVLTSSADCLSPAHACELAKSLETELEFFESLIAEVATGIVEPAERRLTARMLIESTRVGARAVAGEPGDQTGLPLRVARFGLRTLGVSAVAHREACPAPDRCAVAASVAA